MHQGFIQKWHITANERALVRKMGHTGVELKAHLSTKNQTKYQFCTDTCAWLGEEYSTQNIQLKCTIFREARQTMLVGWPGLVLILMFDLEKAIKVTITYRNDCSAVRVGVPCFLVNVERPFGSQHADKLGHFAVNWGSWEIMRDQWEEMGSNREGKRRGWGQGGPQKQHTSTNQSTSG